MENHATSCANLTQAGQAQIHNVLIGTNARDFNLRQALRKQRSAV